MSFGGCVALVKQLFWPNGRLCEAWTVNRDASVVKRLFGQYGPRETEAMIRGAHLLGWQDLRGLASAAGVGRRWASSAWWQHENSRRTQTSLDVRSILRDMA